MSYLYITNEFLDKMYEHCDRETLNRVLDDMRKNGNVFQSDGRSCNLYVGKLDDSCIDFLYECGDFDNTLKIVNTPVDGNNDVYDTWDITDFIDGKKDMDYHITKAVLEVFVSLNGIIRYKGESIFDRHTLLSKI